MRRQKQQWYIWGEWENLFWFHSCYIAGLTTELSRRTGITLPAAAADQKENVQRFYVQSGSWLTAGKKYLERIVRNPKRLEKDLLAIERAADTLYALNAKLVRLNPGLLSKARFIKVLKHYHFANHELWAAGMVPNLLELNQGLLSDYLRTQAEVQLGRSCTEDEWQAFVAPTELTNAQKAERFLLKLAIAKPREPGLTHRILLYLRSYGWLEYGWIGPKMSAVVLRRRLRLYQGKNPRETLVKRITSQEKLRKMQHELKEKIHFNAKHQFLVHLLRRIIYDKSYRMDALYQGYAAFEPFLDRIAGDLGTTRKVLYTHYLPDVIHVYEKGQHFHRSAYTAFLWDGVQQKTFIGAAATRAMKPVLGNLAQIEKANQLKGQVAYRGTARGNVKLVNTTADIRKLNDGDILVSHMTDPSLLPAMQRAAAFVTDMGGLTCHAAIVARELHTPCVVGTKTATKVFQDGDLVEVDAVKGIVRKI